MSKKRKVCNVDMLHVFDLMVGDYDMYRCFSLADATRLCWVCSATHKMVSRAGLISLCNNMQLCRQLAVSLQNVTKELPMSSSCHVRAQPLDEWCVLENQFESSIFLKSVNKRNETLESHEFCIQFCRTAHTLSVVGHARRVVQERRILYEQNNQLIEQVSCKRVPGQYLEVTHQSLKGLQQPHFDAWVRRVVKNFILATRKT
jgi:hypothetical protein